MKPRQRMCVDCKRVKPLTEFYLHNGKPRAKCRACERVVQQRWEAAHSERRAAEKREQRRLIREAGAQAHDG